MESLLIKASFAFTRASCLALQGWQLMEIGTPSFRMTIHLGVCVETSQGEILGMQPSKNRMHRSSGNDGAHKGTHIMTYIYNMQLYKPFLPQDNAKDIGRCCYPSCSFRIFRASAW